MNDFDKVKRVMKAVFGDNVQVEQFDNSNDNAYDDSPINDIVIDGWITFHARFPKGFDVTTAKVIPGVMYYPDGSGQPDDVDIEDVVQEVPLQEALAKAVELIAKNRLDGILENIYHEECYESEQEYLQALDEERGVVT